jgi:hypothetical protein
MSAVKKVLLLIVVVLAVFAVYNRQRLYVRDPLANVTRDGVEEKGVQVYINYSNDVLLENDNPPRYATLLQKGQPLGSPRVIQCVHWLACLTEADVAPVLVRTRDQHIEAMTAKAATFRDDAGREAVVTLR